jgi:hypothetical protein
MGISQNIDTGFDVGVFQGSAVSIDRHPLGYAAGERHELIVFLRQPPGDDTDPVTVESVMRHAGWRRSMLSLLFVLPDRSPALAGDETLQDSYRNALEHGAAVIVCRETV